MLPTFSINQGHIPNLWRIRQLILNQDIKSSYVDELRTIAQSEIPNIINRVL